MAYWGLTLKPCDFCNGKSCIGKDKTLKEAKKSDIERIIRHMIITRSGKVKEILIKVFINIIRMNLMGC